jgi:hypothetical protein
MSTATGCDAIKTVVEIVEVIRRRFMSNNLISENDPLQSETLQKHNPNSVGTCPSSKNTPDHENRVKGNVKLTRTNGSFHTMKRRRETRM